ncbi:pyridoxal phosphate-dependent aminotransferase [Pigmentiphaga soli]|uniref:Pyridoxal phosphate-dependent aminotransferase n=1 Tax=Pigmentiphaga soli TaxID=1007095 RepID=A0ABP8H391_9BURK
MFNSKLPGVGTTIFTTMSRLAAELQAINLGQGYPDFDPDPVLLQRVARALGNGHHQYAPMAGIETLRRAIAAKTAECYGARYDADTEVTVTSGATQALMTAVLAAVGPGDEAIVLEPVYDSYVPAIRLAGGIPVAVPLRPPRAGDPRYRPDWGRVRAAITPHTRLLMINFPHNPTGTVLQDDDLDELERIVEQTGILLVSDEVYEHMVYDGVRHASVARRPALAARAFLVSSFGKTYHATGWKIGYCCAPAALTAEFRKIHQFMVFSVSTPMQHALAEHLADPAPYLQLPAFYAAKRDRLAAGLRRSRFRPLPCPGTYFMLADYSAISDLPEIDFVRWLAVEHRVAAIPVAAFHGDPDAPASNRQLVRFCFAKRDETLDDALERMRAV